MASCGLGRLVDAFAEKLLETDAPGPCWVPTEPSVAVMRRFLGAVGSVEPQVWGQLLPLASYFTCLKSSS